MSHSTPNRLITEKSPYLLQHAYNPVDWHPWGENAFAKAKREDKLVLVSIGYATCHWCHVMERESFENPEIAEFLNQHFIAIKVDREERPDIDQVFMDALHALGQQGGWPLNMFATPEGQPFTGGTYFPPQPMYGRRSFSEILRSLEQFWRQDRSQILEAAGQLTEFLLREPAPFAEEGTAPTWASIEKTVQAYRHAFDKQDGGFSLQRPNKFPPSMGLQLLLRYHQHEKTPFDLDMVEFTLEQMRRGGIYDQVGGGLCRYSTDYQWRVPHFEKMLYDNALFAQAALEVFQVTGNPLYREITEDVLAYIGRDMILPEGGFCSAEDADSEGEEGRFYVWDENEFQRTLASEDASAWAEFWNISTTGNFEGKNILYSTQSASSFYQSQGWTQEMGENKLRVVRQQLLNQRSQRIRPLRDDKVLTSWNALMISTYAQAARVLQREDLGQQATRALEFLHQQMVDSQGRLLRRYREGDSRFPAYLCDYAQLGLACLDLYAWNYEPQLVLQANHWAREINRLFLNPEGAYFETGEDAEVVLTRKADGHDGVEPSGNTSTAQLFLALNALGLGSDYRTHAERIFMSFAPHLEQAGVNFSAMHCALMLARVGITEVVICGDEADSQLEKMLQWLRRSFLPQLITVFVPEGDEAPVWQQIPLSEGRTTIEGQATAYVCQGQVCQAPVHSLADLQSLLRQLS